MLHKMFKKLDINNGGSSYSERLDKIENDLKIAEEAHQRSISGGALTEDQVIHLDHFPRYIHAIATLKAEMNDHKVAAALSQRADRAMATAKNIEGNIVYRLASVIMQAYLVSTLEQSPGSLNVSLIFSSMIVSSHEGEYHFTAENRLRQNFVGPGEIKSSTSTNVMLMQISPFQNDHYHAQLRPIDEVKSSVSVFFQHAPSSTTTPPPGPTPPPGSANPRSRI